MLQKIMNQTESNDLLVNLKNFIYCACELLDNIYDDNRFLLAFR